MAVSAAPVVIWPSSRLASSVTIWSLPPRTWNFSLEGPNKRSLPWPEYPRAGGERRARHAAQRKPRSRADPDKVGIVSATRQPLRRSGARTALSLAGRRSLCGRRSTKPAVPCWIHLLQTGQMLSRAPERDGYGQRDQLVVEARVRDGRITGVVVGRGQGSPADASSEPTHWRLRPQRPTQGDVTWIRHDESSGCEIWSRSWSCSRRRRTVTA